MKKIIDLKNPWSFYYLWHTQKGQNYIINLVITNFNIKDNFNLLDMFNDNGIRSYFILESDNYLIYFGLNDKYLKDDEEIVNFLKKVSNKKVLYLLFNENNMEMIDLLSHMDSKIYQKYLIEKQK